MQVKSIQEILKLHTKIKLIRASCVSVGVCMEGVVCRNVKLSVQTYRYTQTLSHMCLFSFGLVQVDYQGWRLGVTA